MILVHYYKTLIILFSVIQACKTEAARHKSYANITKMYTNDTFMIYGDWTCPRAG